MLLGLWMLWQIDKGWTRLQAQEVKHLHVLTALVVGGGQQLVTIKDAVGPCHEAQRLQQTRYTII